MKTMMDMHENVDMIIVDKVYNDSKKKTVYKGEILKPILKKTPSKKKMPVIAENAVDKAKNKNTIKKNIHHEITFKVYNDEDGMLCASGIDHRIYTFGKTYNKLIKNINDIVELYFGVPYKNVTINLKFEAQENSSVETATC